MMEGQSAFKSNSPVPTIDLASITQALVVAECLSFHRAGIVLGKEPSTVGRRVRALEDVLGVSFWGFPSAPLRPTAAGRRFCPEPAAFRTGPGEAVECARAGRWRVMG